MLGVFRANGSDVIAEDLGVIPDFVRASLALLGVPGFRVFRWERAWHEHGQPFRDPSEYPVVSVATTGTHDTEPLAVWWDHAPEDERRAILAIPSVRRLTMGNDLTWAPFNPQVRDVLIEALCASASRIVILPCRTSSAGTTASTSRRRSATRTGPIGFPGPSTRSTSTPTLASVRRPCEPGRSAITASSSRLGSEVHRYNKKGASREAAPFLRVAVRIESRSRQAP